MTEANANPQGSGPTTIHCTQCGQAMRVAPQHMQIRVACPHCREALEPWRVGTEVATPPQQRATPPQPPQPESWPPAPGPPPACCDCTPRDYPPPDWTGYSWRNRWVAGALGVLLGPWGVHRFYLGYIGTGVLQIVVTIATFGIGGLWGFIEGILCLVGAWPQHDADGLPLRS